MTLYKLIGIFFYTSWDKTVTFGSLCDFSLLFTLQSDTYANDAQSQKAVAP